MTKTIPTAQCISGGRLSRGLIDGYADFYAANNATHALTISLGTHPRSFSPEVDFLPQLKRIAREIARMRGVPKRKRSSLTHTDAVWMAGFYEATDASGMLFPHWHGVIALEPDEEPILRQLLCEFVGHDRSDRTSAYEPAPRCIISTPGAKPSFDLQPLTTAPQYIRYASKSAYRTDLIHWTIADILPIH
jgi:hypothetical protein